MFQFTERRRVHRVPVLRRLPVAALSDLQREQEVRAPQRLHGGIRRAEVREVRRERPDTLSPLLNDVNDSSEPRQPLHVSLRLRLRCYPIVYCVTREHFTYLDPSNRIPPRDRTPIGDRDSSEFAARRSINYTDRRTVHVLIL